MTTIFKTLRASEPEEIPAVAPSQEVLDVAKYLNPRQTNALMLLMQGRTNQQVASEVGVNLNTLRAWMLNPDFQWALNYFRAEVMQHSIDTLRVAQNAAVTLMLEFIQDPMHTPATRIKAASKILDITTKRGGVLPPAADEDQASSVDVELRDLANKNPDVAELLLALDEQIKAARDDDDD